MYKRLFLSSIFVLGLFVPAVADDSFVDGNTVCDGETLFSTDDVNLVAEWAANSYDVTYLCGSGTGTPPTTGEPTYATNYTFASNTCSYTGHKFANWSCTGGLGTKAAESSINWQVADDVTCTAQWNANTVNITWYSDDATIQNVGNAAQCTYDGTLNLPTQPTKTGYTFAGWRVRQVFDLSTLAQNVNEGGYMYGSRSSNGICSYTGPNIMPIPDQGTPATSEPEPDYCTDINNKNLNNGEWRVYFMYGVLKGTSICSGKVGNNADYTWKNSSSNWITTSDEITNASGEAKYCWCNPTQFQQGRNYYVVKSPSWIFVEESESAEICNETCAALCAFGVKDTSTLRDALYGSAPKNVVVTGYNHKTNCVKTVRAVTGLGLKGAKDMVDNVPTIIKENVSLSDATSYKTTLETYNGSPACTVEIQ